MTRAAGRLAAAAVALLGLAGCGDLRFAHFSANGAAFQGHPRVAIVAFDSFDFTRSLLGPPSDPAQVRSALDAAHKAFLDNLRQGQFNAEDLPIQASCKGDMGDLCRMIPAPGLEPVNLSPSLAQSLGASAQLLVEVHVLFDYHCPIEAGLWKRLADCPDPKMVPTHNLYVRAFGADGKLVWEDREDLQTPLTLNSDVAARNMNVALVEAAKQLVGRLALRTKPPPPAPSTPPTCHPEPQAQGEPMARALLVVDDEPSILTALQKALSLEGYGVDVAGASRWRRRSCESEATTSACSTLPSPMATASSSSIRTLGQARYPVVMMSGHATIDTAARATKLCDHALSSGLRRRRPGARG